MHRRSPLRPRPALGSEVEDCLLRPQLLWTGSAIPHLVRRCELWTWLRRLRRRPGTDLPIICGLWPGRATLPARGQTPTACQPRSGHTQRLCEHGRREAADGAGKAHLRRSKDGSFRAIKRGDVSGASALRPPAPAEPLALDRHRLARGSSGRTRAVLEGGQNGGKQRRRRRAMPLNEGGPSRREQGRRAGFGFSELKRGQAARHP